MTAVAAPEDMQALNDRFEHSHPIEVVRWAAGRFKNELLMTSSFGAESAVLLHMAASVAPGIRVVFIDTGFLFPETHRYMEVLRLRLDLNVWHFRTRHDPFVYLRETGEADHSWRNDIERCCAANKNEPMERAMREIRPEAWLRGIRRGQSQARRERQFVEWSTRYGCYAVSPLLRWGEAEARAYMEQNSLPAHPLAEQGYRSIGCNPRSCTRVAGDGEDARAGRWAGTGKLECGLHLEDYQI